MIPTEVHSFSRSFAKKHGATAAVLLKHLAYKVGMSKNKRHGKRWHYNSAKKLQSKLPYLSSSTISAQVKALQKKGLLEIANYNKWKHDKTQWYHVPRQIRDQVRDDLISFDAEVAKKVGILPAVLHFNLHHFIRIQIRKKVASPKHTMSPQELAQLLPFSESAIKKGLKQLWKKGLIIKLKKPRSTYGLPDEDAVLMSQTK
jgi:DNA-binding MarR family transcriptional regulator